MAAIALSGSAHQAPTYFSELLDLLALRPQPAVVFYGADQTRVELSGRVLANWAVKLIGLFDEEYDLAPGDVVTLDTAQHWKAAAVLLAVGAAGAEVTLEPVDDADVIITDRPAAWIGSAGLGGAELAALSAGMLDSSFEEATGEAIPAWVLDVSAEVRQQPDQLMAQLPAVALPDAADAPPQPLVLNGWQPDSGVLMLTAWACSGVVVLFEGAAEGQWWEQMRRNEGLA